MNPAICNPCENYKQMAATFNRLRSNINESHDYDFNQAQMALDKYDLNGGMPDNLSDEVNQLTQDLIQERVLGPLLKNRTRLCRVGHCALQRLGTDSAA